MRIRPSLVLAGLAAYGALGGSLPGVRPDAVERWQREQARALSCHARAIRALGDADERGLEDVERWCVPRVDPFAHLR